MVQFLFPSVRKPMVSLNFDFSVPTTPTGRVPCARRVSRSRVSVWRVASNISKKQTANKFLVSVAVGVVFHESNLLVIKYIDLCEFSILDSPENAENQDFDSILDSLNRDVPSRFS